MVCRFILAFASMMTMNYLLVSLCDPIAWLGAGVFTAVAYRYVIRKVRNTLQPAAQPGQAGHPKEALNPRQELSGQEESGQTKEKA